MIRTYTNYPEKERTTLYTATVNQKPLFLAKGFVRKYPFAVGNVDLNYDITEYNKEEIAFASFEMEDGDEATVILTPNRSVQSVIVRPLSRGVRAQIVDGKVCFTITKCGQYTVELDGVHNALHLFADAPKDYGVDIAAENVIYFGAGEHFPGHIELKDNSIVFLDEGAVVHGAIAQRGVKNVKILGKGILDRSPEYRHIGPHLGSWNRQVFFWECENVEIDGVIFRDSPIWVISVANTKNVSINNVKMVGMWSGSTDGLDVVNSQNITLTNSFLRNSDDNVTIKGFVPFTHENNENIHVENCVLWCDWGVSLQIGAEVCADYYRNITFKNCDIIHAAHAAMSFQSGGYADISNVRYEDIRVEYSAAMRAPKFYLGESDVDYGNWSGETRKSTRPNRPAPAPWADELFNVIHAPADTLKDVTYAPEEKTFLPWLIHLEVCEHWHDMLSPEKPFPNMHDVHFKDISILAEEGVSVPPSAVRGYNEDSKSYDVTVENLTFNGKKLTDINEANFIVGPFAENVVIK